MSTVLAALWLNQLHALPNHRPSRMVSVELSQLRRADFADDRQFDLACRQATDALDYRLRQMLEGSGIAQDKVTVGMATATSFQPCSSWVPYCEPKRTCGVSFSSRDDHVGFLKFTGEEHYGLSQRLCAMESARLGVNPRTLGVFETAQQAFLLQSCRIDSIAVIIEMPNIQVPNSDKVFTNLQ